MDARMMVMPEIPDLQDDDRPRWIRHAHQQFNRGYTLYVDEAAGYALWRHITRSTLNCPINTVTEIIGELGERFAEQITIRRPGAARAAKKSTNRRRVMSTAQHPAAPEDVETRAPDDEDTKGTASEETIPVVLDRRTYTSSELGAVLGKSHSYIHGLRSRLTHVEPGMAGRAFRYVVDEKLLELLRERGYAPELAGDALATVEMYQDGEKVEEPGDIKPELVIKPASGIKPAFSIMASGSEESGASPPRRLLDDIADFIVDDDIPGSHDDQDAASEPDGVPEDSFVFVSSAENFVGRPTGDGYDELPEDEDADGPVLVPAKVSLLPVANAVDAMSRATKVLRCVLHALYFDVESADGDDTHDGMAFIVQGEVNNLLEAHEGLEKYLEARRG